MEALETGPETEEYVTANLAALTECRARLVADDVNPALANSAESAADVEALREALGYEEWNLFGISYGTRLALTVLQRLSGGGASVILDSVFPLEEELLTALAPNLDRALTKFLRHVRRTRNARRTTPI